MAVDVYVMPLWRFRAGFFTTATERFARESGIPYSQITSMGTASFGYRIKKAISLNARWYVNRLKRKLNKQSGMPIGWRDDGAIVYSEQFHCVDELRLYAKHIECYGKDVPFCLDKGKPLHSHPLWQTSSKDNRFPLLIGFDFYTGYILPVAFDSILLGDSFQVWGRIFQRQIVSLMAIENELLAMNELLNVPENWDHKNYPEGMFFAMAAFYQLREILRLSREFWLPVIFYG